VFAVFLGIAEVVRNWGDWSLWPFWLVDYICVGLLVWGWFAVKNRHPHIGNRRVVRGNGRCLHLRPGEPARRSRAV